MTKETTTEKAPRKQFMKWLTLGKDKDPEFNKTVFLAGKDEQGEDEFNSGRLKKIEIEQGVKVHHFIIGFSNGEEEVETHFTHFSNPVSPK